MRRLLRNDVAIVAVGQLLQQVITMGTGIILARVLGSSGYGIVNLLRTLFTGLMTVAPLGLDLALLKYCGRHAADADNVAVTVSRLRIVAGVMNILVAVVIGLGFGGVLMRDVYRYDQFDTMLLITLAGLPFAADLGVMGAVYKAKNRPGLYALMTVYLQPVLRLFLTGVVVVVSPTIMAVVVINTIQIMVSSVAVMINHRSMTIRDQNRAETARQVRWGEVRNVLSESLWMALNMLVYGLMRFVDILMLGFYLPASEVGEYAALSTISLLVQVYPLAASQTLGPTVSRQYHAGDLNGVRRTLDDYIYLATLISGFIFAGIAVFGTRLDLVFGKSFHFQQGVTVLMPIGYLLSATLAPTGFALSMTGRHRAELGILVLGGAVLVVLCRILIPVFGQSGAAFAVAMSFFIINTVRFGYVAKVLGFVPGHWRDFMPPAAGLLLAYLARNVVDLGWAPSLPAFLVACVLYAALYGAACQLVLLRPSERDVVGRLLRGRLSWLRAQWS